LRVIEVDGTGEARGMPDTATLNLAIETHAVTAEEAASRNGALAAKIVAALKSKLGDKGKISTGGYSLNPEYDQRPGRDQAKIVSYTAQNSITAETGALDLLGALIDVSIAAGANRVACASNRGYASIWICLTSKTGYPYVRQPESGTFTWGLKK
jgi:uncharacterized protein YggE